MAEGEEEQKQEEEKPRVNRQWLLKERPDGEVDASIFEYREVEVPDIKNGEVLIQTLYLSFDATQRIWIAIDSYMPAVPLGDVVRSFGLAQVLESKDSKFARGDVVAGLVGWQDFVVFNAAENEKSKLKFDKVPGHLDLVRALALLPTGVAAYFGLSRLGKPKRGETVAVNAAAGATGSMAAQIAKVKGCRVIGVAGGPEKCKWLVDEIKCDAAIDYKNESVNERLKELCPDGVNVFFDNVGGEQLEAVLNNMADYGRIVICGAVANYDLSDPYGGYGVKNLAEMVHRKLSMMGLYTMDFMPEVLEAIVTLNEWADEGKIKVEVDMQEGFDKIPETLLRLYSGANRGKQMLKVVEEPPLPLRSNPVEKTLMKVMAAFYNLRRPW